MTLARKPSTSLSHYDPVKGMLSIHAAGEAKKRARRARDVDGLNAAIERKLRQQRDFVAWWDSEAERQQVGQPRRGKGRKYYPENGTILFKPEDFGVTVKILSNWRIHLTDPETFQKTLAAEQEHARRRLEFDIREQKLHAGTIALPPGIFRVLYADPPWSYGNNGVINDADGYGRAARHYPSMTIAELCAIDVIAHVADDAVLFLWVTSPLLAECWPVIEAWGFSYKTSMVWDKQAHNYGHYVSVQHELLLICTRGSCLPDQPTPMPASVVAVRRSDTHSEKPAIFREIVERLYPVGPRLELFGRQEVAGWTVYGNQVGQEVTA